MAGFWWGVVNGGDPNRESGTMFSTAHLANRLSSADDPIRRFKMIHCRPGRPGNRSVPTTSGRGGKSEHQWARRLESIEGLAGYTPRERIVSQKRHIPSPRHCRDGERKVKWWCKRPPHAAVRRVVPRRGYAFGQGIPSRRAVERGHDKPRPVQDQISYARSGPLLFRSAELRNG